MKFRNDGWLEFSIKQSLVCTAITLSFFSPCFAGPNIQIRKIAVSPENPLTADAFRIQVWLINDGDTAVEGVCQVEIVLNRAVIVSGGVSADMLHEGIKADKGPVMVSPGAFTVQQPSEYVARVTWVSSYDHSYQVAQSVPFRVAGPDVTILGRINPFMSGVEVRAQAEKMWREREQQQTMQPLPSMQGQAEQQRQLADEATRQRQNQIRAQQAQAERERQQEAEEAKATQLRQRQQQEEQARQKQLEEQRRLEAERATQAERDRQEKLREEQATREFEEHVRQEQERQARERQRTYEDAQRARAEMIRRQQEALAQQHYQNQLRLQQAQAEAARQQQARAQQSVAAVQGIMGIMQQAAQERDAREQAEREQAELANAARARFEQELQATQAQKQMVSEISKVFGCFFADLERLKNWLPAIQSAEETAKAINFMENTETRFVTGFTAFARKYSEALKQARPDDPELKRLLERAETLDTEFDSLKQFRTLLQRFGDDPQVKVAAESLERSLESAEKSTDPVMQELLNNWH